MLAQITPLPYPAKAHFCFDSIYVVNVIAGRTENEHLKWSRFMRDPIILKTLKMIGEDLCLRAVPPPLARSLMSA